MHPLQSLLTWCLLGALFCGAMPLFGGALLYHGLQRYSPGEFPLRKCIKCFFIAAGVAYLLMMFLGRWLPEIGPAAALAFACFCVTLVELALITMLVRRFTLSALLTEAAAVLTTNVAGYTMVALLVLDGSL